MKRENGSWTAEGVAFFRALESACPEGKRRCYDPLAQHLLNPWLRLVYRNRFRRWIARIYVGLRHGRAAVHIVARTSYIDFRLSECIDDGIEQLVILGAGFDSRAFRFPELRAGVSVFEVDHPATQRRKLERLKKVFGTLPSHVTFVPVDFERETLEQRLLESGYDRGLQTLFIWEGVVMYLPAESVDETLAFITRNSATGSSIIFDYVYESLLEGRSEDSRAWRAYLERIGEPPRFGIEEGAIEESLNSRGLLLVENWTDEALKGTRFSRVVKSSYPVREVAPHGGICLSVKP